MRKIKFRAWVTEYSDEECPGEMIYLNAYKQKYDYEMGFVYAFSEKYSEFWAHENYKSSDAKFVVMQFTGLHDKNGKEIYEGDIVKYPDEAKINQIGVVVYRMAAYFFEAIGGDDEGNQDIQPYEPHSKYYEIVGNIYENPELLGD